VHDIAAPLETTELSFLDSVMRMSEVSIMAGSALPIDPAALEALTTRLRPVVLKQLTGADPGGDQLKWFDDSKNVVLAANMLGVIAMCIARLNHQVQVDNIALTKAFTLVKTECGGTFGPQGCYCGC
jgi:hypothetical protein